jgi:hypothetical protein
MTCCGEPLGTLLARRGYYDREAGLGVGFWGTYAV